MSKKHWFGFHIFVLMFSSAGILLFHLLSIAAPFITIPSLPKEMLYLGVATGYGIAISLAIISIYAIWKMITRVTIIEPTKTDLNKEENNKI